MGFIQDIPEIIGIILACICVIILGILIILGIFCLLGALLLFALSEFGLITFTWYRVLLVGLILLVVDAVT